MALLIFLMLLAAPAAGFAEDARPVLSSVIYDSGNPETSVGILNGEIFEVGDLYENFQVVNFERDAIVLKDQENFDNLKWIVAGEAAVDPELLKKAKSYFVVRQLREIHAAQIKYLKEFEKGYAPDLTTLIRKGFLADGFENDIKQGYFYRIAQTGETGRMAPHYVREPIFFAVAEPQQPEENGVFFSIDQLEVVRFSPTLYGVSWGPVWDYKDHSAQKKIVVKTQD